MSDPNYAPYGVDDDPFLTHPAGVGRAPLRADNRYGAPQTAGHMGQRGVGAAPSRLPPAPPQPSYYAPADAIRHGEHAPSASAAQGRWAQQSDYEAAPHYAPQSGQYQTPYPPQQGNFHPRGDYDAGYDDRAFGVDYSASHPQYADDYAPVAPQPRPEPRLSEPRLSEPRLSAPPHATLPLAAPQRGPAQSQHQYAPRAAVASFSAPQRAAAPVTAPRAEQSRPAPAQQGQVQGYAQGYGQDYGQGYGHDAAQYSQRDYAPLPNHSPAYAGYEDESFSLGFLPSSAKLMQWAGALCTVLAVVGAGYWGYALAVRDAHGIPVVRAQVDPLRIAPETPGGEVSANQGLAVNTIPAAGTAAPIPDQITLAPQMAELAPEDTQIIENGSFAQTAGAGSAEALAGASDKVLTAPETTGGLATDLTALPNALPEDMPMTDAEAVERALETALAEGGDPIAQESAEAMLAPAEPASMSNADPIAPPTAELDPATIAVGTPLAQLGAFDTPETARTEWANLQTRFTELMAGKALVVEPAKSGGRDFFRLRAHGFASEDDTRRFCAAILAENGSCFPVDQR